jgi:hypothetical protein
MLRVDLDAPRKQRHTARRIWERLIDEHGLELSYSSVRDYVARRRPEIMAETGRAAEAGFVPQAHPPGAEAEVDFADLWIDLRGARTKVFLFTPRLSGKAVHRAFASRGQEAFLEVHLQAFSELGGVESPAQAPVATSTTTTTRSCFMSPTGRRRGAPLTAPTPYQLAHARAQSTPEVKRDAAAAPHPAGGADLLRHPGATQP